MLNNYILPQIASRCVCLWSVWVCLWSVCVFVVGVCVCGRCVFVVGVCVCGRCVYVCFWSVCVFVVGVCMCGIGRCVCVLVVGNASMIDLLLYVTTIGKIHESRTLASRRPR